MIKDYPALDYQDLVRKTIAKIEDHPICDEGLRITFTDGSYLEFGFSGCEGVVKASPDHYHHCGCSNHERV